MNKKFYFALALTAGLFASCSSDDLTSQAPAGPNVNDNDAAVINIAVANPGVTRGTGTVGGTDVATNVWAGQTFNLFMFEKGTFNPAQKTVDDGTGTGGTMDVDIYNNAQMSTPNDGTTAASYVIGTEQQFNYYPTTGAYSFWAYRVDDAGTGTAGVGVPVGVSSATATEVTIPFVIDGSQDILTAVPDEAGDLADLQNGNALKGVTAASTATADQIYTAYSSRRGVTPTLQFKHQLTRLTFQVKAATIEVSDAALSAGAGATYNGFKVTGITVKSKSEGNIIAAWKDGSSYSAQGVEFTKASEDWADPSTLVSMPLKSRGQEVTTPQTGEFTSAIEVTIAADGTPTYPANYTKGGTTYPVTPDLAVYDANTTNSYTGIPNGHLTTLAAMVADYITANNTAAVGDPVAVPTGSISGYVYTKTAGPVYGMGTNAAAQLVDLEAVTPAWTVTTTATHAETTLYTIPAGVINVADNAALVADAATQADGTYTYLQADDHTYREVVVATGAVSSNTVKYTVTGAEVVAADDAAVTAAQDAAAATGVTVYIVGGTKYVSSNVTAAAVSSGTPTDIGEALLVAPNAPKYEVTLTYKRWKKTSTSNVSEIEGTVTKEVTRNGGAYFNAGKSYNVVITLYKDGDASTDTNIEAWDPEEDINIEGEE